MGCYCCGIYDQRPEMCRRYPEPGSYMPPSCTFYFIDGERRGACDPGCNAACCMLPRKDGEPGGAPIPEIAGGQPCKHIMYTDQHPSMPGERSANPATGSDIPTGGSIPDAIELVLAAKRRSDGGGVSSA